MFNRNNKEENLMSTGNQSIHRCFDILEMLAVCENPLTINEIAEQLDMSLSAIHSLLKAMIDRGYVSHLGRRQGYVVGPYLMSLCLNMTKERELINLAKPHIEELSRECDNETCYLGHFQGFAIENLITVISPKLLATGKIAKKLRINHAAAQGKVLLAFLPQKDYERWKREVKSLRPYTQHTITDFERLEEQLNSIRNQGFAENTQETEEGVYVIAAPIFNFLGRATACVAMGMPILRLDVEKKALFTENVIKKAFYMSKELGCPETKLINKFE